MLPARRGAAPRVTAQVQPRFVQGVRAQASCGMRAHAARSILSRLGSVSGAGVCPWRNLQRDTGS